MYNFISMFCVCVSVHINEFWLLFFFLKLPWIYRLSVLCPNVILKMHSIVSFILELVRKASMVLPSFVLFLFMNFPRAVSVWNLLRTGIWFSLPCFSLKESFCIFIAASTWKDWCNWFSMDYSSSNSFTREPGQSSLAYNICILNWAFSHMHVLIAEIICGPCLVDQV